VAGAGAFFVSSAFFGASTFLTGAVVVVFGAVGAGVLVACFGSTFVVAFGSTFFSGALAFGSVFLVSTALVSSCLVCLAFNFETNL